MLRVARLADGVALTVDLRSCHSLVYRGLWRCMEGFSSAAEERQCVLAALHCCEELLLAPPRPPPLRAAAFVHRLLLLAAHLPSAPLCVAALQLVERLLSAFPSLRGLCEEVPAATGRFLPLLDDCDSANAVAQAFTELTPLLWSSDARVVRAAARCIQRSDPAANGPATTRATAAAVCSAAEEEERRRPFPLPPPPSLLRRPADNEAHEALQGRKRRRSRAPLRPALSHGSDFLAQLQRHATERRSNGAIGEDNGR